MKKKVAAQKKLPPMEPSLVLHMGKGIQEFLKNGEKIEVSCPKLFNTNSNLYLRQMKKKAEAEAIKLN